MVRHKWWDVNSDNRMCHKEKKCHQLMERSLLLYMRFMYACHSSRIVTKLLILRFPHRQCKIGAYRVLMQNSFRLGNCIGDAISLVGSVAQIVLSLLESHENRNGASKPDVLLPHKRHELDSKSQQRFLCFQRHRLEWAKWRRWGTNLRICNKSRECEPEVLFFDISSHGFTAEPDKLLATPKLEGKRKLSFQNTRNLMQIIMILTLCYCFRYSVVLI